ncbi:DNA-binding NarL/FixJ family response regulator [Kutzneria buriramensis]|uniref:DNA-binding NarL/FixJ family response regulator n=1 Tax=Kutzneria buriramensis TaxID=1045776 RepID=A0A3E0HES2_9PSEU|nr:DNA-binding NarL/FixJ family response regulator [Kutzneria buriramensis]
MLITVLIVDDHPVVREGVRALLAAEPDLEVVGDCGSGADAVAVAGDLAPDVVLMDVRMPDLGGAEATKRIVATTDAKVLMLTTYDNDADVLAAVAAGAVGYLLKDSPRDVLVAGVRATARGETVLSPTVASRLVNRMRRPEPVPLTARELDVLRCVARGLSNPDIGRALFISETTVKSHLVRIFDKLEVSDRTAAVTVAIGRGLLPVT